MGWLAATPMVRGGLPTIPTILIFFFKKEEKLIFYLT
jgi:hypothetical protein